jgi:hypothetical protein
MKVAPPPFEELDYKAARRLIQAGYTSREQVMAAVQAGRLSCVTSGRPRQYGLIHHKRVLAWLGLPITLPLLLGHCYRPADPSWRPEYTPEQGQYLAYIFHFTRINYRLPTDADVQRYFRVSMASVRAMILSLDTAGWVFRPREKQESIAIRLKRDHLPDLNGPRIRACPPGES